MKTLIALTVLVILMHALEGLVLPRLAMKVTPQIILSRTDIKIEVRVRPEPDNRLLQIAWDSDFGVAGASVIQLDGEDDAVIHTVTVPSAPPANYAIVANLFDKNGKKVASASGRVMATEDR